MRRILPRRPSPAFVLSFIALSVALGGTATAISGRDSVTKDDIREAAVGKAEIRRGAVGKAEARTDSIGKLEVIENSLGGGQVNEKSLRGVGSASGLTMWAVVSASGQIVRGQGIKQVFKFRTGGYNIFPAQDVSKCAVLATVGTSGSVPPNGTASVTTVSLNSDGPPDGIQVWTYEPGGKLADRPFHLGVVC